MYDKFKELDKRTYELRKDLIEAEKRHREKVAQNMTIDADDKSVMQVSQGTYLSMFLFLFFCSQCMFI